MAISYVGERGHSHSNSSATSYVVTLTSNAGAGNRIILFYSGRLAGTVSSVADSRGNTWTIDKQGNGASSVLAAICSTRQDVATLQSGDTITVSLSGSATCHAAMVEEFSGLKTASPVDKTAENHASAVTSGDTGTTAATSQADELAVCTFCLSDNAGVGTPTLGSYTSFTTAREYANVGIGQGRYCLPGYKILSATGTQNETASWSSANTYQGLIVTYIAPGTTTYTDTPSGTITLSGSATEASIQTRTIAGTVLLDGIRSESWTETSTQSGSITITGTISESWGVIHIDTPSGTITLSGNSTIAQMFADADTGTITLSGSVAEGFHSTRPSFDLAAGRPIHGWNVGAPQ